jgi:hypothetical protein
MDMARTEDRKDNGNHRSDRRLQAAANGALWLLFRASRVRS